MPIKEGKDNLGYYFQFGNTGKKYHYKTPIGKIKAYNKCILQMKAIEWSKHK